MWFGAHTPFIVASYAFVALVVLGLIIWVVIDGRAQARKLSELEARGVRRRSASDGEGAR